MTITFPRDMISNRKWDRSRLVLERRQELSRTADGRLIARDLGPAVWRATEFSTVPMPRDDADRVMAAFLALRGSLNTFFVYDVAREYPVAMTAPGQYDLSTITVAAVASNRDGLSLSGLPAGFKVTSGDFISVRPPSGGRELFRVVDADQASYDGMGTTPVMQVEPHVRANVASTNPVDLIRPMVEVRLDPGGLDDPYQSLLHRRITFTATQVLR